MTQLFRSLGRVLAQTASDKKAEGVVLLDVRRQSAVAEYMLIATVSSPPHLEAVEEALSQAADEHRCPALRRARPQSSQWRVLDFGGLLAHIMTEESRSFYSLEKLYHQARPVAWQAGPDAPAAPRARRQAHP